MREARKRLKLTQKQLAAASGVSQTTISDIERGRNETSADIVALARALKVTAEWLADGVGEKHPSGGTLAPPAPPESGDATNLWTRYQSASLATRALVDNALGAYAADGAGALRPLLNRQTNGLAAESAPQAFLRWPFPHADQRAYEALPPEGQVWVQGRLDAAIEQARQQFGTATEKRSA